MQQITNTHQLHAVIAQLESNQAHEWDLLKDKLVTTYENLKPGKLIKNTLSDLRNDEEFKNETFGNLLGAAAGYISKTMVIGSSDSPLKQVLGTTLQWGVTKLVSKNADEIKSAAAGIIDLLSSKTDSPPE